MRIEKEFVEVLKKRGVKYVFGIEGGSWIPYMESMRANGLEFILVANESSAGIMADVCYRITGTPGVCYATYGPGATNLSTGIGCAWLDRSSIIAVTSEFAEDQAGKRVQMNIDHQLLFEGITKMTFRLNGKHVRESLNRAFDISMSEVPGPVHIGIPSDAGGKADESLHFELLYNKRVVNDPDPERIKIFENILGKSKRPIIAAGLSAARYKLGNKLKNLADRHRIPVFLTPMAKGLLSHSHICYSGVLFHAMSRELKEVYKKADLVIGIGYDPVEFCFEEWIPDVPLINIDTSPADGSEDVEVVFDITGNIGKTLDLITAIDPVVTDWDFEKIKHIKDIILNPPEKDPEVMGPIAVLKTLRAVLRQDGILTCDVGAHTHLIGQIWEVEEPGMLLMTNGWSSMGFGVPSAIAAKLCLPERDVVCVTGDGGFLMMAGEIITARRLNLNVVFLILADRELSLIRIKQDNKGLTNYGIELYNGYLINEKSFFGVPVRTIENRESLASAIESGLKSDGPLIIEALIDGSEYNNLISGDYK